jgi:hypothetical protein
MSEPAQPLEFPTSAITYPTGQAYIVQWIKAAISNAKLEPVNSSRLNGQSTRKELLEVIESLKLAHEKGGPDVAKKAWYDQLATYIPDIAIVVNKPRRLYHADDLDKLPPLRWLIEGEIPEKGFSVMYGDPEVGKSFEAISYAERVTMRPGKCVVYVAAEGESGYKQRHKAWMLHHKKQQSGSLYFWFDAIPMLLSSAVDEFIGEILHLKPNLIIIDTLARCMEGGDENSARDMGIFIASCRRLQREMETAVMVIHHTGKAGSGERGSSALRGAADTMIHVSDEDGYIMVSCAKIKDGRPFPTRMVKRLEVPIESGVSSCVHVAAEDVKSEITDLTPNQTKLVRMLSDNVYDAGARTTDIKGVLDMSNSTFYKAIRSLKKRNIVEKRGQYDPWVLTPFGIRVAQKYGFIKQV